MAGVVEGTCKTGRETSLHSDGTKNKQLQALSKSEPTKSRIQYDENSGRVKVKKRSVAPSQHSRLSHHGATFSPEKGNVDVSEKIDKETIETMKEIWCRTIQMLEKSKQIKKGKGKGKTKKDLLSEFREHEKGFEKILHLIDEMSKRQTEVSDWKRDTSDIETTEDVYVGDTKPRYVNMMFTVKLQKIDIFEKKKCFKKDSSVKKVVQEGYLDDIVSRYTCICVSVL